MPITLAKLAANRASATIDFGDGDVLHVEYYPARITGKMMTDLAASDRKSLEAMSTQQAVAVVTSPTATLAQLLASWDLAEDIAEDGTVTPMPLDHEHIEQLGIAIQWTILNGIMAALGDTTGKSSAPEANGSPSNPPSGAISSPTEG